MAATEETDKYPLVSDSVCQRMRMSGHKEFFPKFSGIGIVSYRGGRPPNLTEDVRMTDSFIMNALNVDMRQN